MDGDDILRLEQLQHPLRRSGDDGSLADDHDGPLDQDRVLGHGVEELIPPGSAEPELGVHGFPGTHHLARVVDAEERHEPLELVAGGRPVEVADVIGVDAAFGQD